MEKKRTPAYKALRLRLSIYALVLWLLAMGLLTWAAAADMQSQLKTQLWAQAQRWPGIIYSDDTGKAFPDTIYFLRHMGAPYSTIRLERIAPFQDQQWESISSRESLWGKWDLVFGFEIAEIYRTTDQPHDLLVRTESHISFAYTGEANWKKSSVNGETYGYISLPESIENALIEHPSGSHATALLDTLRMTGWFEGCRFHPVRIEAARLRPEYTNEPQSTEDTARLDSLGLMYWDILYELPSPDGQALETIYCWDLDGYVSPLTPVTANGQTYNDLVDYALSGNFENADSMFCSYYSWGDQIQLGEQTYHYTIVARYWPLQYAFFRLIPTYVVTAIVVSLCMYLLRWILRRRLLKPLEQLVEFGVADTDGVWAEPYELNRQLTESRKALAETKTELKQTQTALEYAQNAEEHRKMLISSIAHELKTPLAVIHSYAEGLQEGIAPDRQAQYLSVILSETERMDEMVLQMLDLSRLEAGKVRLTTEEVELLALTEGVVKKLAPLWEAKELTIHYPLAAPLRVMADEARMEQVLTNLIGNAVKYSPPGSRIQIKLFRHDRSAHFRILNQAPHLSEEARQKVWDSFYRADPSRTEPGTGLGLALVKRIIDLHRGSCSVQNTRLSSDPDAPTALEFGFTLPVS